MNQPSSVDRLTAPPDLFGRGPEISEVAGFIGGLAEPSALLIEGQAGIGKTSVWRATVTRAAEAGIRTLAAFPTAAETKLPYAGLGDLFAGIDNAAFEAVPAAQRNALDAALLRGESSDDSKREAYQMALGAGTLHLLTAMAKERPIVVAIDDVQWLDLPSVEVLSYAFRRLDVPVGLVMTARTGEARPAALDRIMTGPRFRRLRLRALTLDELDLMILERFGKRLPLPVLIEVGRSSGGNPMFALELARALRDGRVAYRPGAPLDVPADLKDVVRGRLTGLPVEMVDVLAMVGALTHPTQDLIVQIFTGADQSVRRAIDEGLLETSRDQLITSHPLYGSVPLSEMSPGRRRDLYARAARAVTDIEESARLLALATDPPNARVAQLLEDAGRRAEQRGAPQSGATLLEQAAEYSEEQDSRVRRMLLAARCFFRSNHVARAVQLYDDVIARCLPGDERAAVMFERAVAGDLTLTEQIAYQQGILTEATDPSVRAKVHSQLAWDLIATYQTGRATEHVSGARAEVSLAGDERLRATAMGLEATLDFFADGVIRRDLAEEAIELERASGVVSYDETSPRYRWALICLWADLLDDSRRYFLQLRDEAVEEGNESALWLMYLELSLLETRAGNWSDARHHGEASDRIGAFLHGYGGGATARVDALEGRLDAARSAAEAELKRALANGEPFAEAAARCILGLAELTAGNHELVISELGRVSEDLDKQSAGKPDLLRFHPDLVEAHVALGRLGDAKAAVGHLRNAAVPTQGQGALAALARCEGWIAVNDGRIKEGVVRLEESVELHRALGQPFELGRTLLLAGRAQRRSRMWSKARSSLQEARDIFSELGSPPWTAKAEGELEKIGGRSPSRWALTPAEEQVATLAGAGRTNREIADELFVTIKTVEWTLSKVYRKLQVRSRTELAALVRGSRTPTDAR